MTSSAGRLFDAVASLCGIRDFTEYEGQAAMELEWRADSQSVDTSYSWKIDEETKYPWQIDVRAMVRQIVKDVQEGASVAIISARFHATLIDIILDVCKRLRDRHQLLNVILSGGVFMNALLSRSVELKLTSNGFSVHCHKFVPANDGGISLGQLAVAAKRLAAGIPATTGPG